MRGSCSADTKRKISSQIISCLATRRGVAINNRYVPFFTVESLGPAFAPARLVSLTVSPASNHTTATGNQYVIGDRVWYNGSVYQCIANNDAINPTNTTYWTLVAVGNRLGEEWNNVPSGSETWSNVSAGSNTWNDVNVGSNTWTDIATGDRKSTRLNSSHRL